MNKFISVVLPIRNEKKHIARCLDSILAQQFPHEQLEILAVDGMSDDGTTDIVREYAERFPHIKLLKNSRKIIPVALNMAVRLARGDIIMRMDAHSTYAPDYIASCVRYFPEPGRKECLNNTDILTNV